MRISLKLKILLITITLFGLITSCKEELFSGFSTAANKDKEVNRNTSNTTNLLLAQAGWFPQESKIKTLSNGHIQITAPDNWLYLGRDSERNLQLLSQVMIDVSCTCTDGSGCDPYVQGSNHCCNMKNNCRKCDKSVKGGGNQYRTGNKVEFTVEEGGFINLDMGIQLETTNEVRPMAFRAMFDHPLVQKGIKDFLSQYDSGPHDLKGNNDDHEDYYFVLNIFGRRALLSIPKAIAEMEDITPLVVLASQGIMMDNKWSCSCTSGSCSFKTYSFLGYNIKYCDSDGCNGTCTLSSGNTQKVITPSQVYKY